MQPVTIDFEASCLPRDGMSFPIEVGICDCRGNMYAWLIKPHASWKDWTWSAEAERLHGISREQLEREGLPPSDVLTELEALIGGDRAISDSYLDAHWLGILAEAVGRPPDFSIDHVVNLLHEWSPTPDEIVRADNVVATLGIPRHRAAEDARYLASWLAALDRGCAPLSPAPHVRQGRAALSGAPNLR